MGGEKRLRAPEGLCLLKNLKEVVLAWAEFLR